ncbi:MAG TPA: response regulator transcription factor, partial [Micromonosporaceae bacterium]|nr:response regulator transcription factor [Micromonosporaceae bacterium]
MPTVFAIHGRASTHTIVSRAVAALPRTDLVGRTTSAVEAARVVETLAPDGVTVDVRLPDGDGIDLAVRLRETRPGLCVVLFGPATHRLLRRAVTEDFSAYVPDTAGAAQAAAAIRSCLAGRASFSSRTLSDVLRQRGAADLSPRELEVDKLLREGLTSAEIALRLKVTESTVRTYVARMRGKIG